MMFESQYNNIYAGKENEYENVMCKIRTFALASMC